MNYIESNAVKILEAFLGVPKFALIARGTYG